MRYGEVGEEPVELFLETMVQRVPDHRRRLVRLVVVLMMDETISHHARHHLDFIKKKSRVQRKKIFSQTHRSLFKRHDSQKVHEKTSNKHFDTKKNLEVDLIGNNNR